MQLKKSVGNNCAIFALLCVATVLYNIPESNYFSVHEVTSKGLINDLIYLFSSFTGFLITTLSVMLTFQGATIDRMKQTRSFYGVLNLIKSAIMWSALAMLSCLVFVLFRVSDQLCNALVLAAAAGAIMAILRMLYFLNAVINIVCKERFTKKG